MTAETRITLKHPIEAHGEKVTELTLKEPTLGVLDDIEVVVNGSGGARLNLGDLHKLVAGMAGIPPSAAKQIRVSDLGPIGAAVMDFLSAVLPAGDD